VRAVARELATLLKRQVVLTIAAGIRLSDLSRWLLGYRRLVRAMPNTPALIGAGIAGLYALPGVDSEGRARAAGVLEAVGGILWCELEEALDAVTAVSGSGPAYVFYFLEALDAAAREVGFTPAEARRLAFATFSGAIRLAEQSDSEPAILRAQVTSKGGTTESAIAALDEARVKAAVVAAVKAAAERAKDLGERFGGEI
jgi:pyrroline-5-carboxylate reductase